MRKKDLDTVIMLFIVISSLFLFTFIILSVIPVKSGSGSARISRFGIFASEVEINNHVTGGNINIIELNKESVNLIEADWNITHTGLYIPKASIQLTYTFKGSRIVIDINSIIDTNDIISLNLIVAFNPSYSIYSFISNTQKANVNFDAFNIKIKNFNFRTSSGNLDINLNKSNIENNFEISTDTGDIDLMLDHLNLFKNFYCHSNSGIQLFDLWNLKFKTVADFNVTSDIGYIKVHWMNHFNKSQNVNINVKSEGDVKVKFWCPLEIMRSDVSLFTVNGTTRISKPVNTYEEISENHFQTPIINDPSLDSYNITARSTGGEVFFFYVNCFKWARLCKWALDFRPYNVSVSGNNSVSIQEHDVTTIKFFNTKYIYLNESRNLTINFGTLPVSSEILLYIEWDFENVHAMGIGIGDLDLKISHNKVSDSLLVYLELNFELDRILPNFNECNITVSYHPNYIFNQFLI